MSFEDLESGRNLRSIHPTPQQQDPSRALVALLFKINTSVAAFQRHVNALGTSKDTSLFRSNLHNTRRQIGELIKEASAKLKQASEADHCTQISASKKITDAKLAKDFQYVLKEFQKAQRLAVEKESAYAPLAPASRNADEIETSSSRSTEQMSVLVESKRQDIILMKDEIVLNEAIIEEREQGIKEIQQQIGEVNDIFKDLAVLVHEQGAMIDDISSNIESAQATTTQGTSELKKAAKIQRSISSNNCLLVVIFGIVLLIVVFVVAA